MKEILFPLSQVYFMFLFGLKLDYVVGFVFLVDVAVLVSLFYDFAKLPY